MQLVLIVVLVDCGAPEVLDDGSSVEYSGTGQGSIATYSCKVGYEMSGEDTRRCLANSTWDGAAPHCLSKLPSKYFSFPLS